MVLAGIKVVDTRLVHDAVELARSSSEPYLFNHVMRSWLFGVLIAERAKAAPDPELFAISAILHDLGLTERFSAQERFEVDGANAARSFLKEHGIPPDQIQLVWDGIALHTTRSIALHTEMAVLKAAGIRGIVIRPGLIYGEGKGYDLPNLIALARQHRAAPYLGTGGVKQGFVHIDDLIDLYMLAFDRAPAGSMLHGVTDEIALGDLAQSASRLVGAPGRTESLSLMEMYVRGGGPGISLSVNKRLASDKTRQLLNWLPKGYDILEDTEHGSYKEELSPL